MINPLPVKNGLNATRAQVPRDWDRAVTAAEFVRHLIDTQRHRAPGDDEAALQARFAAGEVVRDDGSAYAPGDRLRPGDFLNFYRQPMPERVVPGELRVLHRDGNLLVVDKPPFLASMPRGQHIVQTALTRARVEFGNPLLAPSHRLDRLTRGVLMFTANREVRGAYQTMFERRVPKKVYEAITPVAEEAPYEPLGVFARWREWEPPTRERPWVLQHHLIKVRGRLSTFVSLADTPAEQGPGVDVAGVEARRVRSAEVAARVGDPRKPEMVPNAVTLVTGVREEWRSDVGLELGSALDVRLRGGAGSVAPSDAVLSPTDGGGSSGGAGAPTSPDAVLSPSDGGAARRVLVWRLEPQTGKTHQLRVVMRSLGLPLLNDPLYEALSDKALVDPEAELPAPVFVDDEDFGRPMGLVAKELRFPDPLTGELRVFNSEF